MTQQLGLRRSRRPGRRPAGGLAAARARLLPGCWQRPSPGLARWPCPTTALANGCCPALPTQQVPARGAGRAGARSSPAPSPALRSPAARGSLRRGEEGAWNRGRCDSGPLPTRLTGARRLRSAPRAAARSRDPGRGGPGPEGPEAQPLLGRRRLSACSAFHAACWEASFIKRSPMFVKLQKHPPKHGIIFLTFRFTSDR